MNFVDIVVGGVPKPVGGVTNFIYRLALHGMTSAIIDLYPSQEKELPNNFRGMFFQANGVFGFLKLYFTHEYFSEKTIYFNFSSRRALFLLLLLPKRKNRFYITLHHGKLRSGAFLKVFCWIFVSKLDKVYAVNDSQLLFYKDIGVSGTKLVVKSTYLPAFKYKLFNSRKILKEKIVVASGFPSSIYNHVWCIDAVGGREDAFLYLFLYGTGDQKEYFLNVKLPPNVYIFWDSSAEFFLSYLASSDFFLRPNSVDSFGVAVADAVNLGVNAIASDVCTRYPGTVLFENNNYKEFELIVNSYLNDSSPGFELRIQENIGDPCFSFCDQYMTHPIGRS